MAFLDPVLAPLLKLPLLWLVILISLVVSLIITVVYKFMTNQDLMKRLKTELKELQKEMKKLRDNPAAAMKVQKKAMETNMKYMGQSFKSTLITFVPIILIFGWMNANIAFEPIMPNKEFIVEVMIAKDAAATEVVVEVPSAVKVKGEGSKLIDSDDVGKFVFSGDGGKHVLTFTAGEQIVQKQVLITKEQAYEEPLTRTEEGPITRITTMHGKTKLLNLFGWKLGWLGTYIVFSIVFSMLLRKMMKVY